jgi:hypothetical protein
VDRKLEDEMPEVRRQNANTRTVCKTSTGGHSTQFDLQLINSTVKRRGQGQLNAIEALGGLN